MSKFRVRFKLQGLEFEIEGSREDAPMIARQIGAQVAALIEPAARIAAGGQAERTNEDAPASPEPSNGGGARRRTRTRKFAASAPTGTAPSSTAIDWAHDVEKWGTAQQGWSTAKKATWLLYVISRQGEVRQMAAPKIAATFNKHFRQAGPIQRNNVSRDLGRLKTTPTPPVAEDSTKSPSEWFLTQQGEREAAALVSEALGRDKSVSPTS